MKTIRVRPADGLRIRDPERNNLIESEGRVVPYNQYWMRRLQDGDVVVVPNVEKKIIAKAKKPSEDSN